MPLGAPSSATSVTPRLPGTPTPTPDPNPNSNPNPNPIPNPTLTLTPKPAPNHPHPMPGLITVRFFSGEGVKLLQCEPDMQARTAMCALTPIAVTSQMRAPFPPLVGTDLKSYLNNELVKDGILWKYEDFPDTLDPDAANIQFRRASAIVGSA